jgi:DNA-binding transcriptional MerR regulator
MSSTMQIGEAAKRTALSVDAIRFYEKRSLLPKPPRTSGRFRLYSDDDVARLDFIRQMQGLGFSLREVRQLLDLRAHPLNACQEVRHLLETKLKEVRGKISDLQTLERELSLDFRKCNLELKSRGKHSARGCPVLSSKGNGKAQC